MRGTPRITNLLISFTTFLLGLAVANFVAATSNVDADYHVTKVRTCLSLPEVQEPKYGPGTEVYRARQERILEIDQDLRDLPVRHSRLAAKTGRYCATTAMMETKSLERERELMVHLIQTADQTELLQREVCHEN